MTNSKSLNRTLAPEFSNAFVLPSLNWTTEIIHGNIPVHFINAGSQDVVKIEASFNAGEYFQTQGKVALACNSMLREGTNALSSAVIAESLDFYGAYLESGISKDLAVLTLFSSNRFLADTLPVFTEVLTGPVFPEKEFSVWAENKTQKLKVDLQKVDFVARNVFPELIFGPKHPYGIVTREEDYRNLNTKLLKEFYQKAYCSGIRNIIVAGKVDEKTRGKILSDLDKALSRNFELGNHNLPEQGELANQPSKKFLDHPEALQSAIRIGRPLFNRLHPDYLEFTVLNTILGGYFGSRLMTNIREDKGYTYGIGSGIHSHLKGGQFVISTEVGVEVTQKAIDEIYHEIEVLQNHPVPIEELELVKNYLLGNFLRSMDGPFSLSERLSSLLDYQLPPEYLTGVIDTIRATTPEKIQSLAAKYLKREDLTQLVVGKLI